MRLKYQIHFLQFSSSEVQFTVFWRKSRWMLSRVATNVFEMCEKKVNTPTQQFDGRTTNDRTKMIVANDTAHTFQSILKVTILISMFWHPITLDDFYCVLRFYVSTRFLCSDRIKIICWFENSAFFIDENKFRFNRYVWLLLALKNKVKMINHLPFCLVSAHIFFRSLIDFSFSNFIRLFVVNSVDWPFRIELTNASRLLLHVRSAINVKLVKSEK